MCERSALCIAEQGFHSLARRTFQGSQGARKKSVCHPTNFPCALLATKCTRTYGETSSFAAPFPRQHAHTTYIPSIDTRHYQKNRQHISLGSTRGEGHGVGEIHAERRTAACCLWLLDAVIEQRGRERANGGGGGEWRVLHSRFLLFTTNSGAFELMAGGAAGLDAHQNYFEANPRNTNRMMGRFSPVHSLQREES